MSEFKIPFDDYFINIAREVARRSNCRKRQIGAVLVADNRIISTGYNGTPRGVTDCCNGGCARCANSDVISGTMLETCWCNHAEENAIIQCAYYGIKTEGSKMYTTFSPCVTCAKLIIQAGVKEVCYWGEYPENSAPLLRAGKVEFRQIRQ